MEPLRVPSGAHDPRARARRRCIEDEVLLLADGKWKLLTSQFPRKLEEVEAWVARARR